MDKRAIPVVWVCRIVEVQHRIAEMKHSTGDERSTDTEAQLKGIVFELPRREAALFVTYSLGGRIRAHVRHYVESLTGAGIDVYVLVMTDRPLTDDDSWLRRSARGLFLRENKGTIFAAWMQIMRRYPALTDVEILYFADDSLLGPTNRPALHAALDCIRNNSADIVGLTDSLAGRQFPRDKAQRAEFVRVSIVHTRHCRLRPSGRCRRQPGSSVRIPDEIDGLRRGCPVQDGGSAPWRRSQLARVARGGLPVRGYLRAPGPRSPTCQQ